MRSIIFLALAVGSALATTSFTADITVRYDPAVYGTLTGTMAYQYSTPLSYMKTVYHLALPGSTTYSDFTTIYNYSAEASYSQCSGSCTAQTIKATDIPLYTTQGTEKLGTSATCTTYTRATSTSDSVLTQVGFNKDGICFALYGSGRRIDFTNVQTVNTTLSASTFSYSSWSCPEKTCNQVMNLVLILDVSGSIDNTAYTSLQTFTKALSKSFTLSSTSVEMSIITFSTDATLVTGLTASQTTIDNAVATLPRDQESTCIGCGINTANDVFSRVPAARSALSPMNVMITVTDGGNNIDGSTGDGCHNGRTNDDCYKYLSSAISTAKNTYKALSIIAAIKTGDYSQNVLNMMATNSSYIVNVDGYAALMSQLQQIIKVTCTSFTTPTCGSTCKGFCACGSTCLCPNDCSSPLDKCVTGSCSTISGVTGCFNTSVSCDDSMACTTDSCVSSTGCVHQEITCTSSDPCRDAACSNSTGCYTTPKTCVPKGACYNASCNASGICDQVQIDVSLYQSDPCYTYDKSSTSTADCKLTPKCSTTDPCLVSVCTKTADGKNASCSTVALCQDTACAIASCDSGKCSYTARTCSDGDLCTDDLCNSSVTSGIGCYWKNHTCTDGNPCTVDTCYNNSCVYTPSTVCNQGLFCQIDACIPVNTTTYTCSHTAKLCSGNATAPNVTNAKCYEYLCNETAKACDWEFVASSASNPCSACRANTTASTNACGWKWSNADTAGLVAGAIAGIVIACVVGFAIFASVSAAGVYKLVQMSRAGNNLKVNNNPMYKANDNEMVNPAYST